MFDQDRLKRIIEAVLMSSREPISVKKLLSIFPEEAIPSQEILYACINQLQQAYAGHAFEIVEVSSGFIVQTRIEYAKWIQALEPEKPAKYSHAVLETLAVIAYKQPVTRAEIEEIRGVSLSSSILKTLLEREWIQIAGYRDLPGKPAVYTTTAIFLNDLNLKSLTELPPIQLSEEETEKHLNHRGDM